MTINQQIKYHLESKKFCKVKRQVAKDSFEHSSGYIVDNSSDFVLMQEADEFRGRYYRITILFFCWFNFVLVSIAGLIDITASCSLQ